MKRQSKNNLLTKDNRIPKIIGLSFLLFSVILFISFVSYLFTWKFDQDKVLQFSFNLFFQSDIEISNTLGRLGAILSNFFIYWGFGLPSFGIAMIFFIFGLGFLNNKPVQSYIGTVSRILLYVVISAVLLEFVFQSAEFPWGGALGEAISDWLVSFLSVLGMIILIIFSVCCAIIWHFNPEISGQSYKGILEQVFDSITNVFKKPSKIVTVSGNTIYQESEANNEGNITSFAPSKKDTNPIEEGLKNLAPNSDEDNEWTSINDEGEKVNIPVATDNTEFVIMDTLGNSGLPEGERLAPILVEDKGQTALFDPNHQGIDTPFDPKKELAQYQYPHLQLLDIEEVDDNVTEEDRQIIIQYKDQIVNTLKNYKIEISKITATVGPTVTLYQIVPAPGVRIARIKNLEDDIALSLAALKIRIIAPLPGTGTVGIEVPNKNRRKVWLREALSSDAYRKQEYDLPIALGKTIDNKVFVTDLVKMPHLLIAGATGQGKSVGINTILLSLLYKKHPAELKLVLVDPKKVELSPYNHLISHFLGFMADEDEPIITETSRVIYTLNSLCTVMDRRYKMLKEAGVRNIKEYNEKFIARQLNPNLGNEFMPFIVLVIDEFADLIMTAGKEVELPISRLAQLARAVGIHLIIATQRPSVNIITGIIKANFPARLAYKVSSKIDSRTIIDNGGADQLIGQGDMLLSFGSEIIRLQSPFVDTHEVEKVIEFIASQQGFFTPYFLPEPEGTGDGSDVVSYDKTELDPLLKEAAKMIIDSKMPSTSMIQRRMKLGFNRAGRIMDQLSSIGVVGPPDGKKQRELQITTHEELERLLETLGW
jgi:DNA segregation ATPase FtsK/SpoIIIE, S-DNA-T family